MMVSIGLIHAHHRCEVGLNSVEILERLISFPTVSRDSNLGLVSYVSDFLEERGIRTHRVFNDEHSKANLFASIGPAGRPGVMLSGHTDVVPVDGQGWSVDPFSLTFRRGRFYGRGTADMKGFVACAMRAAAIAAKRTLKTPLWLSFSYDEEIGCIGVRRLIELMSDEGMRPRMCIVGEPTSMQVVHGHKGKTSLQAVCRGSEAHTAYAPRALNALHLACDLVSVLRQTQDRLRNESSGDSGYEIPYTTIHAARIAGGDAPNIVPAHSEVNFEIRNIARDDPAEIIAGLEAEVGRLVSSARDLASEADISFRILNDYPGLDTPPDDPASLFVQSLVGQQVSDKVAFGTEGGLFARDLGTPTVICGPGSMDQGHKPDEYIDADQIGRCEQMMFRLVGRLEEGI